MIKKYVSGMPFFLAQQIDPLVNLTYITYYQFFFLNHHVNSVHKKIKRRNFKRYRSRIQKIGFKIIKIKI